MAKKFTSDMFRELMEYVRAEKSASKAQATQFVRGLTDDVKHQLYEDMKRHQAPEIVSTGNLLAHAFDNLYQPEVNQPVPEPLIPSPARSVVKKKTSPSSKPRKVTYSFKIDPSVLTRLRQLAETEERDVSDLIRLAVNNYLKMKSFT